MMMMMMMLFTKDTEIIEKVEMNSKAGVRYQFRWGKKCTVVILIELYGRTGDWTPMS